MAASPNYQRRPFLNPPREFPRDQNGLVSMDVYHNYLLDDAADAPIDLKRTVKAGWMYQHIYFQRPFYMQPGVPRYIRDETLRRFCTSPYNQVAMREDIEDTLHNEFEEHVIAPPPETMRRALLDFDKLDILGATAVGRRVALVPEALKYLAPEAEALDEPSVYSPVEKAALFDGLMEKTLHSLDSTEVISQRIVTGAIARIARMLNNERLHEETKLRLAQDSFYYPVRLRRPKFYYQLSGELLSNVCTVIPIENAGLQRVEEIAA